MANVQKHTSSTGVITYRVGYYYDNGKFKYTPKLANRAGADRIKAIIEKQGYKIALKILDAQQRSDSPTLREWFERHLAIKAIEIEDGSIAEREAKRTWMPRLGDRPLDAITKDDVIDWVAWQKDRPATLASAVEHQHISRNVAYGVPLPKDSIEDKKEIFSQGRLGSVLQQRDDRSL